MPKRVLLHLIIPALVLGGSALPICAKNIVEKEKIAAPAKLEALTPKLDESEKLKLHIEETRNLDIGMPTSTNWNQLYNSGRTLFAEGDYRRALNAFRAAYVHGGDDGGDTTTRDKATRDAIELTKRSLTNDALLGYKLAASAGGTKTVTKVFRPSLAWLAGIKDGDKVLSQRTTSQRIELQIERKGKRYAVSLRNPAAQAGGVDKLLKLRPTKDNSQESGRITNPYVLQANEKQLIKYDVVVLIDCSGSMSSSCTTKAGTMSKWDWCVASSRQLLADAGNYFPNGITVVPFQSQYSVLDNVKVGDVNRIYEALKPGGGTELASPLGYVLQRHFLSPKRPLAIAVLTDGMPNDVDAVRSVIADAAARTSANRQVVITFLQVGDVGGAEILRMLDEDLVSAGASRDIVDSRYFDEVQNIGIKGGLVAAIMEREAEGAAPAASTVPETKPAKKK